MTAVPAPPVLTVDGLTVRYGSALALSELSLGVEHAGVLGVLGPNGAGKSTLLNSVVGLVKPVAGRIELEGRDLRRLPVEARIRSGIALVAEGRRAIAPLTVLENLRLGAGAPPRRKRGDIAGLLDEAFTLFPVLERRRHQEAGTLSGGEAAMLGIARALMSRPRLLLLDEPALGLAPMATARLFERLLELKRSRMTMVIVEQKAGGLLQVADRVAVMSQGRIVAERPAAEIRPEELQAMYFGDQAAARPSRPPDVTASRPVSEGD